MKLSLVCKIAISLALLNGKLSTVTAQNTKPEVAKPLSLANTLWVQYSPFTLVEPEVPITATIHYKISNRIAVALDAGVFIAKQNYSDDGFEPYGGFRLKPAIKYYLQGAKKGPRGFYFSLEGLAKRTIDKKEEWLSQPNSNGQPAFFQLVNYKERKLVYGASLIFGGEIILDKKQRWMLDFYQGLGFRKKQFKANNLPDGFIKDYNFDNSRNIINVFLNGTYISLPGGFKVGYRIK